MQSARTADKSNNRGSLELRRLLVIVSQWVDNHAPTKTGHHQKDENNPSPCPHPNPLPEGEGTVAAIFRVDIFDLLGRIFPLSLPVWIRRQSPALAPEL